MEKVPRIERERLVKFEPIYERLSPVTVQTSFFNYQTSATKKLVFHDAEGIKIIIIAVKLLLQSLYEN